MLYVGSTSHSSTKPCTSGVSTFIVLQSGHDSFPDWLGLGTYQSVTDWERDKCSLVWGRCLHGLGARPAHNHVDLRFENGRFLGKFTAERRPTGSYFARAARDLNQNSVQEQSGGRQEPSSVGTNAASERFGREEGCEEGRRDSR